MADNSDSLHGLRKPGNRWRKIFKNHSPNCVSHTQYSPVKIQLPNKCAINRLWIGINWNWFDVGAITAVWTTATQLGKLTRLRGRKHNYHKWYSSTLKIYNTTYTISGISTLGARGVPPSPRLDIYYITHGRQKVGRNFEHAIKYILTINSQSLGIIVDLNPILQWAPFNQADDNKLPSSVFTAHGVAYARYGCLIIWPYDAVQQNRCCRERRES